MEHSSFISATNALCPRFSFFESRPGTARTCGSHNFEPEEVENSDRKKSELMNTARHFRMISLMLVFDTGKIGTVSSMRTGCQFCLRYAICASGPK